MKAAEETTLAVAWSLPEDGPSDVEPGALPISGDYLSPYFSVLDGEPSPVLTSSGPSGAAVAATASISAAFKNRGVAFTGVSVTVNGVPVEHTLATDGGSYDDHGRSGWSEGNGGRGPVLERNEQVVELLWA